MILSLNFIDLALQATIRITKLPDQRLLPLDQLLLGPLVNICATLISQVKLKLAEYVTEACPYQLVSLMSILDLLLNLTITGSLHDIERLLRRFKSAPRLLHVLEYFLCTFFQLCCG